MNIATRALIATTAISLTALTSCSTTTPATQPTAPAATTAAATPSPSQPSNATNSGIGSTPVETGEIHNITPTAFPTPTTTAENRTAQPTGSAGKARGLKLGKVDRKNPKDVASAFVATAWNYDTAIDKSPNDAGRRAAQWATPEYAADLKSAQSLQAPGAWWNDIATHKGYTTTALSYGGLGEPPPDTPTEAYVAITVTATPTDGKLWKGDPLPSATLIITLSRSGSDADWAVATSRVV